MDHPSIFSIRLSKKFGLSVLELNSTATRAAHFNSSASATSLFRPLAIARGRGVVGLGGFEPPTSRLSGVRSNQTEL